MVSAFYLGYSRRPGQLVVGLASSQSGRLHQNSWEGRNLLSAVAADSWYGVTAVLDS